MLEYICNEGERDAVHYTRAKGPSKNIRTEILARYMGTYKSKEGDKVTIRLADGQLYMDAFPLVPQSDAKFESADSDVEFFTGQDGIVTHLIDRAVEGDVRFDRIK